MPETISGRLDVVATSGQVRVSVTSSGDVSAGGQGGDGTFLATNGAGKPVAVLGVPPALGPDTGVGTKAGMLVVNDATGHLGLAFRAGTDELVIGEILRFIDGTLRLGSGGKDGKLMLRNAGGGEVVTIEAADAEVHFGGSFHYRHGLLRVGSEGQDGILFLMNGGGSVVVSLDSRNGEVKVKDSLRYIDGSLRLGGGGENGLLLLRNSDGVETIRVDGQAGDVVLANADCAEEFDLAAGEQSVAGAVMVFDAEGALRQSDQAYDGAVAGVVSGAGSFRPGIVLDRRDTGRPRAPLAMVGKVFCLVDADHAPVTPGALLTTSPRRGHAMRAVDPPRAFGAVLGKALKPLAKGQALLPVMVALQ